MNNIHNLKLYLAKDGVAGVEQVKRIHPQLVLTDLQLPLLAGETLIDSLRKANSATTIISLSATEPQQSVRDKLDDVLIKPVSVQKLIAKLHKYLT